MYKFPSDMYGINYSQRYFKNLKDFIEAQKVGQRLYYIERS